MNIITFVGFSLDVIGKLLIAWVTIRIHVKHFKKHRVKPKDIRLDIWLSGIGISFIALGYFLQVPYKASLI